jgi:hypothetical protein
MPAERIGMRDARCRDRRFTLQRACHSPLALNPRQPGSLPCDGHQFEPLSSTRRATSYPLAVCGAAIGGT